MKKLIEAAKAVIYWLEGDYPSALHRDRLIAAVERAERIKHGIFPEWDVLNESHQNGIKKGQQAERERIRAKVLALGKDWVLDTTTKQYADLLLEDN